MRILLAGATGTLGRPTVEEAVAAGHDVVAVSRHEDRDAQLRAAGARPVRLDLFDGAAAREAAADVDVVVNLATSIPPSSRALLPWAWRANDRLRRDASRTLADAATAVGVAFVQESFAPTAADGGTVWIDEDHPLDPVVQTRSVVDAERAAAVVTATGGRGVVLRFGLFQGPDAPSTADLLGGARRGRLLLPGPQDRYTSMVLVRDAARAVVAALDAPAGTYLVVEDEPSTIGEHAAVLARLLDVDRVRPLPDRAAVGPLRVMGRSHRMSNRRLREATGWAPTASDAEAVWRRSLEVLDVRA